MQTSVFAHTPARRIFGSRIHPDCKHSALVLILLLGLICGGIQAAPQLEPFPADTRFAAFGDSITHGGLYALYIQLYYTTRFPQNNVDVLNIGLGGDSAAGGLKRISWDVLPAHPSVVSIMFGMNDVHREFYAANASGDDIAGRQKYIDMYEENIRNMIQTLKENGMQVILITPSIFDDTSTMNTPNLPGVNNALEACAQKAESIATQLDVPVIDFQHPMRQLSLQLQAKDPAFTLIGKDRVHPQHPGYLLMSYLFLKAQHAPGDVSKVIIEAPKVKVIQASRCAVDQVESGNGGLHFRYTAKALPFPVDNQAKEALNWVPFTADLNQETLQINGLSPGSYQLSIDNTPIRVYTAEDLAKGINLAMEAATPQYKQAQQVLALLKRRWSLISKQRDIVRVEFSASRNLPRPLTLETVQPLIEGWLKTLGSTPGDDYQRRMISDYFVNKPKEAEIATESELLLAEIRATAHPQAHYVFVTRIQP